MTKRPKISDVVDRLSPDEAVDGVRDNPDSVLITMEDARKHLRLTRAQMLAELRAGRLTAVKVPDGQNKGGFFVMITARHMLDWQVSHGMRHRLN
jgi:hypothetical protein